MVRGINSFRDWFRGYKEQYAIIGGTACDLLMTGEGLTFRATKDVDLVLIVEAVDASFGQRFWEWGRFLFRSHIRFSCRRDIPAVLLHEGHLKCF